MRAKQRKTIKVMTKETIKSHSIHIQTLTLIYKFRYISAPLLAELRHINRTVAFRTLETLYQKDLLYKRFDKSYRLLGKPASYSLNINGINYLKERIELNKNYAHTHYKNKSNSERFITESLDILRTFVVINESYPDTFTAFTKAEMTAFSDKFPKPLPHLYLNRMKPKSELPNFYMLDILVNQDKKVIAARLDKYFKHYESDDWEEEEHPVILLVVADSYIERETLKMIESKKDSNYIEDDELVFMLTTQKALFSENKNIWTCNIKELAEL
jgi:hypothetical protein